MTQRRYRFCLHLALLFVAVEAFAQVLSPEIRSAIRTSDWKKVEVLSRRALQSNVKDRELMTVLSVSLLRQGKVAQALEQARSTSALYPMAYQPLMIAGDCYVRLNSRDSAIKMFRLAQVAAPDSSEPPMALGMLLSTIGRCEEAITYLEESMFRRPENVLIVQQLARCYMRLRRSAEASELAMRSAELRPDDADAQLLAGETLMAAQRKEQGLPFLERAIERGSRAPSAFLLSTAALQELGRTEEAFRYARLYTEIAPNDAQGWYNVGLLQIERKQLDSALRNLRKAISIKSNYPEAYYNLARVYDALGFAEDAVQSYRRCATSSGLYAGDSFHALALLYRKAGNFTDAMKSHNQAVSISDTVAAYRIQRLRTCIEADRCSEARPFIDRDVELFPKHAAVLFEAARCYVRNNDRPRADAILETLRRIAPSYADELQTFMRL
jgi:tetratricopeptide (TPR) repeat protein